MLKISDWTVDYGQGPRPVRVPHAWRQDVPVWWEGPAVYRTRLRAPERRSWLVFEGVSYQAAVALNGRPAAEHRGIWDAFSVDLGGLEGQEVDVEVRVVKNGGPTFPVRDVASGFIPYVYNTFGGIYRDVWLAEGDADPLAEPPPAKPTRVRVDGRKVYVDGKPFYARGVLTWGWYPELGHLNPDEATIRREVLQTKQLGFNLIKFCLWVPPHRFLEIMREEGLEAWLELPLWDPSPEPERLEQIAADLERIVAQYRRHDNIVLWTVGCELSTATPPEYRRRLVEMVKRHTGCPLVKDNSGGAEMYGGDLREYGDFYDFHPYCDTNFYPVVLDCLMPGPRTPLPVYFGEFNDIDVHRDIARIRREMPYWAADDRDLNDKGVRWQFDIPRYVVSSKFTVPENREAHERLMESTRGKAIFTRKAVHEQVRAREAVAGYVVTGWRDTPISTAGVVDDWGELRYAPDELRSWNFGDALFPIPRRRPPWIAGGNRPGWLDPYCHFLGPVLWKVGAASERGLEGRLRWVLRDEAGAAVAEGEGEPARVGPLDAAQIGELFWTFEKPGRHTLTVEFGAARNEWTLWALEKPDFKRLGGWRLHDPARLFDGLALQEGPNVIATRPGPGVLEAAREGRAVLLFLVDELAQEAPFWRESGYEFFDDRLGVRDAWERLLAVSGDRVIDLEALGRALPVNAPWEVLINRVDVRTYAEAPIAVQSGKVIATTLRPFGGLGAQPLGIARNPSGQALLAKLMELALGA